MRQFASVLLGRRGFILRTKEHILSLIIYECDVFFTSGKCFLRTVISLNLLFQIVTLLSRGKSLRKGVFINRREVVCSENLVFSRDSILYLIRFSLSWSRVYWWCLDQMVLRDLILITFDHRLLLHKYS